MKSLLATTAIMIAIAGSASAANIGVSMALFDDNFLTVLRNGLVKYAGTLDGVDVQVEDAQNDVAKQLDQINNFVASGVDAIIVNPVDTTATQAMSDAAAAGGIPLVYVNREPVNVDTLPDNQAFVASDEKESGTLETKEVCRLFKAAGKSEAAVYVIMGELSNQAAVQRTQDIMDVIGGPDCGVKISIIDKQTSNWQRDQAQNLMTNWLSAGAAFDGVIANNDESAIGVPRDQALRTTKRIVTGLIAHHRANDSSDQAWGHGWQSSLWTYYIGYAGWLISADLTPDQSGDLARMLRDEADYRAKVLQDQGVPYMYSKSGRTLHPGDSYAEENAWNSMAPSLAAFAFEEVNGSLPEFTEGASPSLEAAGLGHPLLPVDQCVVNDVSLGGRSPRLLLVSGSNMSGKSTLLRTIGVNVVLAQAGTIVRAKRFRLTPLMPGATLRVQDSLRAGRSRFYAEVARLRQLLDLASERPPLLFLLDEVLHGTNSHDRLIGAEAVLRKLLELGALGLATTHDLALTAIAGSKQADAINVHFQDMFENGKMTFDYKMRLGVVGHSNALELMRSVGIDV